MKVGVIGASGYVGGELLRILLQHPEVEVSCATSRRYRGEYVYRVHPNLRGLIELQFTGDDLNEVTGKCDLIFTSVPHGTAVNLMPSLVNTGLKIIDMSADYRLKNLEDYVKWYGYKHPHPDLLKKFVYGAPELHREEIRGSSLVSCPGCMAITSILALAPLVKNNAVDRERIVVDAKIGSSGGGAKPSVATHHSERYGVVRPYKAVGHRHTGEIEQELSMIAGSSVKISMSTHAVNLVRGILCTCHAFTERKLTTPEVWKMFRSFYVNEPFIRFVKDKKGLYKLPDPKFVVGSNFCDIGFEIDDNVNRLVVLSATDNLVKGAAGSAVQCMNIMRGFDEKTGLMSPGLHPG